MKKVLMSFILICFLVAPALAENLIVVSSEGDKEISIDSDTVSEYEGCVVAWTTVIFKGESLHEARRINPKISYSKVLYAFSKKSKRFQWLNVANYSDDGSIISDTSAPLVLNRFEKAKSGSNVEKVYRAVMRIYSGEGEKAEPIIDIIESSID